ncbi:hypothetical protein BT63DRAFT_428277 [Microthyrium microscopicum]|uniref:DUF7918 domain-containing protein n=1 Tax=Microthyrium microscopicum TaxID=703497 RepID=A0A6A6U0Y2_9PEZI|nr:hypothetical protein BT63DRAFT_428277 [Microthyrium microscopicum]
MPKIPTIPGLSAAIRIDEETLHEYDNEDEFTGPNKISKYIEAVPGAQWDVTISVDKTYHHLGLDMTCYLYIDGQRVENVFVDKSIYLSRSSVKYCGRIQGSHSYTNGVAERRPFVFSELQIEERSLNASDKDLLKKAKHLGTIRLIVVRCRKISDLGHIQATKAALHGRNKIPEKLLKGKAISSLAGYGAAVSSAPRNHVNCDDIDTTDAPLADFVWHYRTSEDLRKEGIVPRTPSPEPLEDRPRDELSAAELRELLQREQERNTQLKKERDAARVKRERSTTIQFEDGEELSFISTKPAKRQRVSIEDAQVIDLTED